jgi:hypothetical protein
MLIILLCFLLQIFDVQFESLYLIIKLDDLVNELILLHLKLMHHLHSLLPVDFFLFHRLLQDNVEPISLQFN